MPVQDNSIIRKQYHSYSPYTTTYGANDEVRIVIQSQDLYLLPSESYIMMEVVATRRAGVADTVGADWATNAEGFFFSEMRYEINDVEIDRIKNPGLTTTLKRIVAYPSTTSRSLSSSITNSRAAITARTYQFKISLNEVFGVCDDYKKIILNAKHQLILIINRQNILTYHSLAESINLRITKIQWKMPHVQLADQAKLQMLKYLEKNQVIGVPYRSWDLFEMPQLPQTTKHIWTVKSTTQICKPRFIFVVFQTNRQTVASFSDVYDHCNIRHVKLHLNNECFPYDTITNDFANHHYVELYHAFAAIQKSYYPGQGENPISHNYGDFGGYPIFTFDCSRTDESLLGGAVDIRLEIEARENIPENTAAYCLIIYDNYFEYSPFSSIVAKRT